MAGMPTWTILGGGYQSYLKGDYEAAYNEWLPLAELGDAEAQYNLGVLYDEGAGVEQDLATAVTNGALLRVRPIMMTVAAIIAGLLPIMLGSGTGSEVMRRIAAPMVGGMISATILTLALIPAIFMLWQQWRLTRGAGIVDTE